MSAHLISSRLANRIALSLLAALGTIAPDATNVAAAQAPGTPSTTWPMDRLILKEGRREIRGLVDVESKRELDFIQIVRPPGRRMYLLVRPVPRDAIAELHRINERQREELLGHIKALRNRARIEAGRNVVLRRDSRDGRPLFRYHGPSFALVSTLDEETTQKVVVRLAQLFRGFRQVLPSASEPAADGQPLTIEVFGRKGEYERSVKEMGLSPGHPALFDVERNRIVAGSDLAKKTAEFQRIAQFHQRARNALSDRVIQSMLERNDLRLKEGGVSEAERASARRQFGQTLRTERAERRAEIRKKNQRNRQILAQITERLFRRLHHESTHAYLESHLYPGPAYEIPRWLNEGIAQVFESAIVEAGDQLRLDAPDAELLSRLQADLSLDEPLPLEDVLRAQQDAFLVLHRSDPSASKRHYLYAWGLAYYLIFLDPQVSRRQIDEYVRAPSARRTPVARFERMVGRSLDDFERQWRAAMRAARSSDAPVEK